MVIFRPFQRNSLWFFAIALVLFWVPEHAFRLHLQSSPEVRDVGSLNLSQQKRENYLFDPHKIVLIPYQLYFDIGVVITPTAVERLRHINLDVDSFFTEVFFIVSKLYSQHNIAFSVGRFEYWERYDRASPLHSLDMLSYARYFSRLSNSMDAYLVISEFETGDKIGWGSVKTVCTPEAIIILKMSRYVNEARLMARAITHELGHIMGFQHSDDLVHCTCASRYRTNCLMYSTNHKWDINYPLTFENCNMKMLTQELGNKLCLLKPQNAPRLFGNCTDGVVDKDEECDCGYSHYCSNLTNQGKCCNRKTCRFAKPNYKCSTGKCCRNCQLTKGTVCRKAVGECDLDEFCDGSSPECPEDHIIQNFELCRNGRVINYSKERECAITACVPISTQCASIFTEEVTHTSVTSDDVYFSQECINEVNKLMENFCADPPDHESFNFICRKFRNICHHFVCAKRGSILTNTYAFGLGDVACLIPMEIIRTGGLAAAPNYMECARGGRHFCFNGHCTNDFSLLRNCNKTCVTIENSKTIKMDKLLYMPPSNNKYRTFLYRKYGKKKGREDYGAVGKNLGHGVGYKIIAPIICCCALILLLLIFWSRSFIRKRQKSADT